MCEYCEESREILFRIFNGYISLTVNSNNLVCAIDDDCYMMGIVKIHYCPMCGKKLEVSDDTE